VEGGQAVKVTGDPDNELWRGYICPKGRALAEQHASPHRLLHSLKRGEDGTWQRISADQAMDEVACKVADIAARHGPRAVAVYMGTGTLPYPAIMPVVRSWMRGLGSAMFFTPGSIDQPGKSIAAALHGSWEAGEQIFEEADTYLVVGMNPIISKCHGIFGQNPGRKIKDARSRGMQMIVVDPRRTETAKQAKLHLPVRPGEDPTLLAAIVSIVIEEELYDHGFVAENAQGLAALAAAVRPFTPDYAAMRCGVPADDIVRAAQIFAGARRGCAIAGTGANFSGRGTVTEYLCLCLNTLCGRWARPGDKVARPGVLLPPHVARAQAIPPFAGWGYGERMRVRGLTASAAGLPTAALSDEMLVEGDGQVKALFCVGANPMMAWPDQRKTRAALDGLELLVSFDCEMSATAELAGYVIASPLSFETHGMSQAVETLKYYGFGLGYPRPWAQYAPPVVQPPEHSELMEEWLFFYGLAQRMGIELTIASSFRSGPYVESKPVLVPVDMREPPTTEDILAAMVTTARVPLEEVKRYPQGRLFEFDDRVQPREAGHDAYLQLGAGHVMDELAQIRAENFAARQANARFPFRLVSRRANNFLNSIGRNSRLLTRGKAFNPLYVHPADLADLGVANGDSVTIRSAHDSIPAVVEADETLRRGVVAMSQAFGGQPDEDHRYRELGSNTNRLIANDRDYDPVTGIPLMGAIPVAIAPLDQAEAVVLPGEPA
jgi:anaerobic selenocysteine-containing dehydrogenase